MGATDTNFDRNSILFNNLISIHAKSENKITQPKSSKGGSIFSFFIFSFLVFLVEFLVSTGE